MNSRLTAAVMSVSLLLVGATGKETAGGTISCDFYEPAQFVQSVAQAAPYPVEGNLRAGVVPHHLLAGEMIASFFARAAQESESYETVIFVAPSHYPTSNRAITSLLGWATPYGVVENDLAVSKSLIDNGTIGAKADDENMQLDHAVSGLIPYVKYYLPKVKVSAILLQNKLDPVRVEALADQLLQISDRKNILLVGSMDFSHYLFPDMAAKRDEETQRAIAGSDFNKIAAYQDNHVDSPQSLMTVMRFAQGRAIQFLDHSSSDKILGLPLTDPAYRDGTTTYFVLGVSDSGAE